MKEIIDKLDFVRIPDFCCLCKRQQEEHEETSHRRGDVFAKDPSAGGLLAKTDNSLLDLNNEAE